MVCCPIFELSAVPVRYRDFQLEIQARIQAELKNPAVFPVPFSRLLWRRNCKSFGFVDVFFPDLFRTVCEALVHVCEASSNQSHCAECNSEVRANAHDILLHATADRLYPQDRPLPTRAFTVRSSARLSFCNRKWPSWAWAESSRNPRLSLTRTETIPSLSGISSDWCWATTIAFLMAQTLTSSWLPSGITWRTLACPQFLQL